MAETAVVDKSPLVLPERMQERAPVQLPANHASPMAMLQIAVQRGDDLERIKELKALAMEMQAFQAKQAFNAAFAAFKSKAVRIIKSTQITDGPLKGKFHANLFDVVAATTAPLGECGLSLSWKLTKDEPTWMEVTCTLRHVDGHSESVSMGGAPDTGPGRNAIQARGSTKSYLERYTATAILGLAAADADDDGNGGASEAAGMTEDHQATIDTLCSQISSNSKAAVLRAYKAQSLADIPDSEYESIVKRLQIDQKKREEKAK